MTDDFQNRLRQLPAIDRLLDRPDVAALIEEFSRREVTEALRDEVERLRHQIARHDAPPELSPEAIDRVDLSDIVIRHAADRLRRSGGPFFRKTVNAAGIVLHTGLGRAVLSPRAIARIRDHLDGYSLLQLDPDSGKRSRRDAPIEKLLTQLTGAEAATVVNNNAAATAIVLNTIGAGREVIVSRGQLVEIGGAFRLPDVMRTSGVRLVEVGSTNKTHLRDYAEAITEDTAAILRVHPSNYVIKGFSSEVSAKELADLAHACGIAMIDDVGAGCLVDVTQFGFKKEPTLPESVAAGSDIVISSADKLIGGPQGGIVLGRKELVDRVRKNPWARIVRVDKLTLAALEATLPLFLDDTWQRECPTFRMLLRTPEDIARHARRLARAIKKRDVPADVETQDGYSQMGSGSLPEQDLPTRVVVVRPHDIPPDDLARRMRLRRVPVFTRIRDDAVLIDPRTIQPKEDPFVIDAVVEGLKE